MDPHDSMPGKVHAEGDPQQCIGELLVIDSHSG
jgi:hypothetical protein